MLPPGTSCGLVSCLTGFQLVGQQGAVAKETGRHAGMDSGLRTWAVFLELP